MDGWFQEKQKWSTGMVLLADGLVEWKNLKLKIMEQNQTNQQPQNKSLTSLKAQHEIINALSLTKIREIANPEEFIGKQLMKICYLLGLKEDQLPESYQVCDWVDGIRKYYPQYAPEELYLACELNHYGKFHTKVEHYGKFSIDYLSNCLKLYEEKKQAEILREKTKIEPHTQRKEIGYHNGRAYYIEIEKWVKSTGKLPLFWDWGKCYEFLLENGDLSQDFPKSRMLEIFERFKKKGMSEATVGRFANQSEKQLGKMIEFDLLSSDNVVKHECRKYVVQQYLTVCR
jgi:hypothetical protein